MAGGRHHHTYAAAGATVWRHLKRGTTYRVHSTQCRVQCERDQPLADGEMVVLYQNTEDGSWSVRRFSEFHDGRFEVVRDE